MNFENELLEKVPLVLVNFYKVVSFRHYAGIILGTEEKKFAIYGHVSMAKAFRGLDISAVTSMTSMPPYLEMPQERPCTHEVLNFVCSGFDIRVSRVVIHDYQEDIFYTRMFLEQKQGDLLYVVDVDARPSDSIPLAVAHKVPILCTKTVYDHVTSYED